MIRLILGALALLFAAAVEAKVPHYDVHARFDAKGGLIADVAITLSEATPEKEFLLSRRFVLQPMTLPRGVTMTRSPVEQPMPDLFSYRFRFANPSARPRTLRFRYAGPITTVNDSGVPPLRPEGYELFIDYFWFPVGADIQTRFTVDATIDGLPADLVVVAQGDVKRTRGGVRIHRDFPDVDLPLVAMRGLKRVDAHGVEFYARDLTTRLSRYYVKHADGAARYLEAMFGPLPHVVRIALVWRERSVGYARSAYTVVSEGGRGAPDLPETNPARHVAHEIAHAWWMQASPLTDDFWLVESTASYMAHRYVEAAFGAAEAEQALAELRKGAATAGPVRGHGRPSRAQLYVKGTVLLVDLERRIGRPAMDRLMVTMAREPVHTTPVFLKHLTEIAGAAAASTFDAALLAP